MDISFDPYKDRLNQKKHGISLAEAAKVDWEEDAEITAAALADPDNPPLKEGEIAKFKPARLFGGKLQAANVVVQSKKPPR